MAQGCRPRMWIVAVALALFWAAGCGSVGTANKSNTQPPPPPPPPPPSLQISGVASGNVTSTSAVISWNSSIPASSQVEYGTSATYGSFTTLDTNQVTNHSQTLNSLVPNTQYHFRVHSSPAAAGDVASSDFTFTTAGANTQIAITNVSINSFGSVWITVQWTTNVAGTSQLDYGTTTSYGLSTTLDPTPVTNHLQTVLGLSPSTAYHLRARSKDSNGFEVFGADLAATTQSSSQVSYPTGWTNLETFFGVSNIRLQEGLNCYPVANSSIGSPSGSAVFEGCHGIIPGWSGGVLRTGSDGSLHQLIITGGGHTSYGGNELYRVDLDANPVTFTRVNDPTVPGVGNCANFATMGAISGLPPLNPNGNCSENPNAVAPNSRHTYGGLAYARTTDELVLYAGNTASNGDFYNDVWAYKFSTNAWRRVDTQWNWGGGNLSGCWNAGCIADFDPQTGRVYFFDAQDLYWWNPSTNAAGLSAGGDGGVTINASIYTMGAIDPVHRVFVIQDENTQKIYNINLDSGAVHDVTNSLSNCSQLFNSSYPGVTFDTSKSLLTFYSGTGSTVVEYNPGSQSCNTITNPGGSAPFANGIDNGLYGRFRYVPGLNVYVLVNFYNSSAFVLKLP